MRDHREDEDQRQAGEQDVQRDLVRRLLPLGALDQRDHPVEEGRARRGGDPTTSQSESTPGAAGDRRAVAAALADHRRGLAGDRRLVDRGDALDDLAVGRDQVAGLDQHDVAGRSSRGRRPGARAPVGGREQLRASVSRSGGAQARGLRLAAALGHGFGEVGEQHREPQPERDLQDEAEASPRAGAEIAQEQDGGQQRHDLGRRTSPGCGPARAGRACGTRRARRRTGSRIARRIAAACAAAAWSTCASGCSVSVERWPAASRRCSATGPRARAGKKVSAADDQDHAAPAGRRTAGRASGRCRPRAARPVLAARMPATASIGTMMREAADQHGDAQDQVVEQRCCRSSPAKAEPLLPVAEV